MANPTTVRLTPEVEAEIRKLAHELGLSFNSALKVLIAEALTARGRNPHRDRPDTS